MVRKVLYRITALFFVIVTFTLVQGYVAIGFAFPMLLVIFMSLILYPKAFLKLQYAFLFYYFIILCIFFMLGHNLPDIRWSILEIITPLSSLTLATVFLYNKDFIGIKIVTIVGLTIIIISSILTLPIVINEPDTLRMMVLYSTEGDYESINKLYKSGIASFGMVHALPFLFPLLIYKMKNTNKLLFRIGYLATVAIPFYMLVKASFGVPIILSTLAIAVSIILSEKKRSNILLAVALSAFLILLADSDLVVSGLRSIQPIFTDTAIDEKISDIVVSIETGGSRGQVGGRKVLYQMSWLTFFENPLFGSLDKDDAGGHAFLVDRLAYFGLVGAIPLIFFFYLAFREHYLIIEKPQRAYYLISISQFVFLVVTKNIVGIEYFLYLFVFLPGLCLSEKSPLPNTIQGAHAPCPATNNCLVRNV